MIIKTNVRKIDHLLFRLSSLVFPGPVFWFQIVAAIYFLWSFDVRPTLSPALFVGFGLGFIVALFLVIALQMCAALVELVVFRSLKQGILGEHRFVLNEEGLLEETSVQRTLYYWPSVGGHRKFCGALMLNVGHGWHIFPRAAFKGDQSIEMLLQTIQTLKTHSPP